VFCDGPCSAQCASLGMGQFAASVFQFVTTIPDDGKDEGGGWQVAAVTLQFRRWTGMLPEQWGCPIWVGMPLRTQVNGSIPPAYAASVSANVADAAGAILMHPPSGVDWPSGIFCSKLPDTMNGLFAAPQYKSLGARVTKVKQ
jgi:hypothetical protein